MRSLIGMKSLVEEAVNSLREKDVEIELAEIIEIPCNAYHSYRVLRAPSDEPLETGPLLRREVGREFDKTLREYLTRAFGSRFSPQEAPLKVSKSVQCQVLGALDENAYVFSAYPGGGHLGGKEKIIGGYLASLLGSKTSYLINVDPNSCKWKVWKITAQTDDVFKAVRDDAEYVEGVVLGKAPAEGIKEECYLCRYSNSCSVEEKFTAQPYPLHTLDIVRSDDVLSALNEHLKSLNLEDDGRNTGFLSPSEMSISSCDRRMVYKLRKEPRVSQISPDLRRIFAMGHAIHEVIQRGIHSVNAKFESEKTASVAGTMISGSCDGVFGEEGLEIKSISHASFLKLKSPKSEHKKQGAIYAKAFGLSKMLFAYYDKATGEIACFYDRPSEVQQGRVVARALRVQNLAEEDGLPPRKTGWGCDTCAYKHTCKPEEEMR